MTHSVMPAKAGIHAFSVMRLDRVRPAEVVDAGIRRHDEGGRR